MTRETREQKFKRINELYNQFTFIYYQSTHENGWQDELNSIIVQLRYDLKKF